MTPAGPRARNAASRAGTMAVEHMIGRRKQCEK
jgi:hypothetical protein